MAQSIVIEPRSHTPIEVDVSNRIKATSLPVHPATWGFIGGTLSDQTDLQAALNEKASQADLQNYLKIAYAGL